MTKWAEMSPEQRDAFIAEKVMGWEQAMPYETFHRYLWKREDAPGLTKETPPFTQSLDAVWLALTRFYEEHSELNHVLAYHLGITWYEQAYGVKVFQMDLEELVNLTPERLCKAILQTVWKVED